MLDLIDRLPRDTYYWQTIMNDPEYVERLVEARAKAQERGDEPPSTAPPLNTWSPEVAALADVVDRLAGIAYILRKANGDSGAQPPKPSPRPITLMPQYEAKRRREQHEKLTARLIRR
jgi:hypothetical protein